MSSRAFWDHQILEAVFAQFGARTARTGELVAQIRPRPTSRTLPGASAEASTPDIWRTSTRGSWGGLALAPRRRSHCWSQSSPAGSHLSSGKRGASDASPSRQSFEEGGYQTKSSQRSWISLAKLGRGESRRIPSARLTSPGSTEVLKSSIAATGSSRRRSNQMGTFKSF